MINIQWECCLVSIWMDTAYLFECVKCNKSFPATNFVLHSRAVSSMCLGNVFDKTSLEVNRKEHLQSQAHVRGCPFTGPPSVYSHPYWKPVYLHSQLRVWNLKHTVLNKKPLLVQRKQSQTKTRKKKENFQPWEKKTPNRTDTQNNHVFTQIRLAGTDDTGAFKTVHRRRLQRVTALPISARTHTHTHTLTRSSIACVGLPTPSSMSG